MSLRSMACARVRRTGCPMRATFRMDIAVELYFGDHGRLASGLARRNPCVQVLPALRWRTREPAPEGHGTRTACVSAMQLRLLPRSEDRGRDHHQNI